MVSELKLFKELENVFCGTYKRFISGCDGFILKPDEYMKNYYIATLKELLIIPYVFISNDSIWHWMALFIGQTSTNKMVQSCACAVISVRLRTLTVSIEKVAS